MWGMVGRLPARCWRCMQRPTASRATAAALECLLNPPPTAAHAPVEGLHGQLRQAARQAQHELHHPHAGRLLALRWWSQG